MSNRLDKEREKELQPKRMEYAINELTELGFDIVVTDDTKIKFLYNESWITLYPYSGWFTGKTVKDGRGIDNLLKQLQSPTT